METIEVLVRSKEKPKAERVCASLPVWSFERRPPHRGALRRAE